MLFLLAEAAQGNAIAKAQCQLPKQASKEAAQAATDMGTSDRVENSVMMTALLLMPRRETDLLANSRGLTIPATR
jgi:hypothetical protein